MKKVFVYLMASAIFLALLPGFGVPPHQALAQSGAVFGPETFPRGENNKAKFSRAFSAPDTTIPYSLSVTHGNRDGSQRVKKITIILNGQEWVFNRSQGSFVAAVRLQSQNQLTIVMKGGVADGFIKVNVEPTRTTLLNSPDDGNFDSAQSGIGYIYGISVDSASHRAYLADGLNDSVIEFDVADARVTRSFDNLDSDSISGNAGTLSVCWDSTSQNLVAINQGNSTKQTSGSLAVININNSSMRNFILASDMHPTSLAGLSNSRAIAFTTLYYPQNRRAYFMDTDSGNLTTREENLALFASTGNSITNEFIFAGADDGKPPALFIYNGASPFRKVKEIPSSARAGSIFDKVAVNPTNNIAIAVNLRESAIFLFDIGAGQEIARIPVRFVSSDYNDTSVAINPQTNMAVVANRNLNMLYVVDLATFILRAELPLPSGINPLSVGIDTQFNRALIGESGFRGENHSGSIIIVQLPDRE
ncbi:MAG: hypothetical protein AB1757_23620 [Acidobacteriota bacterium]